MVSMPRGKAAGLYAHPTQVGIRCRKNTVHSSEEKSEVVHTQTLMFPKMIDFL